MKFDSRKKKIKEKNISSIQHKNSTPSRSQHSSFFFFLSSFGLFLLLNNSPQAYPTVTGCPALTDADFALDTLVTVTNDPGLDEPLRVDVMLDNNGMAEIYYIQRGAASREVPARVKLFREATGQVIELAEMPPTVLSAWEDGLVGMALDPDFKTNGWIYLFHVHTELTFEQTGDGRNSDPQWWDSTGVYRVNRYTIQNDALDFNSETLIIEIPGIITRLHSAGDLEFDAHGDLWISLGDNTKGNHGEQSREAERTSSCLNDLKGSILRITPQDAGGYTVPSGNLADFYVQDYPGYADEDDVKPEIYAKGVRNPYSITVHPTRRWLGWGDCGPDFGITNGEEHNFTTTPGFFGYPYFLMDNQGRSGGGVDFTSMDPEAPVNNNNQCTSGASTLPPAFPSAYHYGRACALGGALYVYDPSVEHTSQLPPQLNNLWTMPDYSQNFLHSKVIDRFGNAGGEMEEDTFKGLFTGRGMIEMTQGPDGAFYIVNYGNGAFVQNPNQSIWRLKYTGSQDFSEECLTNAGVEPLIVGVQPEHSVREALNNMKVNVRAAEIEIQLETTGTYRLNILGVRGETVKNILIENDRFILPKSEFKPGIYLFVVDLNGTRQIKQVTIL